MSSQGIAYFRKLGYRFREWNTRKKWWLGSKPDHRDRYSAEVSLPVWSGGNLTGLCAAACEECHIRLQDLALSMTLAGPLTLEGDTMKLARKASWGWSVVLYWRLRDKFVDLRCA